jgi:hypothetical protein
MQVPRVAPPAPSAHAALPDRIDARLGELADRSAVARWTTQQAAVAPEAIAAGHAQMRAIYGVVDARGSARQLTGWLAGPVAGAVAALAVADRIGIDLAASHGVELGLAPEGYVAGLRISRPSVQVLAGHEWAAESGVEVTGSEEALDELVVAGIVAWCAPVIAALDSSGRGSAPLWAQVTDALGYVAAHLGDALPGSDPALWIARTERMLAAPSRPSRRLPALWVAETSGDPVAVCHRASCCMYYRSQPPEGDEPVLDADFHARFGDDPMRHCGTCCLRSPEDVEARTVYWAERALAEPAPSA